MWLSGVAQAFVGKPSWAVPAQLLQCLQHNSRSEMSIMSARLHILQRCEPLTELYVLFFPQQPERLGVLPIKLRGGLGQPPETLHQVPRGSEGMEPVPK